MPLGAILNYSFSVHNLSDASLLDFGHSDRCAMVAHSRLHLFFPNDMQYVTEYHTFKFHLPISFCEISSNVFNLLFIEVFFVL